MSKNKREYAEGSGAEAMADNILVMDVEGTDGRERGEDQDFERKSALFALATSEVLIVNIWEHQVGLYQGANMGLLKTVFEVNLQLFLKDKQYVLPSPASTALTSQIQSAVPSFLCNSRPSWNNPSGEPAKYPCPRLNEYLEQSLKASRSREVADRGLFRLRVCCIATQDPATRSILDGGWKARHKV